MSKLNCVDELETVVAQLRRLYLHYKLQSEKEFKESDDNEYSEGYIAALVDTYTIVTHDMSILIQSLERQVAEIENNDWSQLEESTKDE